MSVGSEWPRCWFRNRVSSSPRPRVCCSDDASKRTGCPSVCPFYPHEFARRQSDLELVDYSALPMTAATRDDFDPLERERLRQFVARYGGDSSLLRLTDKELEGALGLVMAEQGRHVPTVTGVLLIGRESALRRHLPTHEVDLFRVPIPNYDRRAFREAFINALVHRDYSRLGAIHVQWTADGITMSNPGGFVEGVTLDNLLVVAPRPRNPLLADAMKRIGLAERTGRGIDLIFQGLLRYGRPAPDYSRTTSHTVSVALSGAAADMACCEPSLWKRSARASPCPSIR